MKEDTSNCLKIPVIAPEHDKRLLHLPILVTVFQPIVYSVPGDRKTPVMHAKSGSGKYITDFIDGSPFHDRSSGAAG